MKKTLTTLLLLCVTACCLVLPISASVNYNIDSTWSEMYYNRNQIRAHFITTPTEYTRPLPNNAYLELSYGAETHKTTTDTNDGPAYTVDIYPYYNDDYELVMGLYTYEPITYTAYFTNGSLHPSTTSLGSRVEQNVALNGYYTALVSNSAGNSVISSPTAHYTGTAYVVMADGTPYVLDLSTINVPYEANTAYGGATEPIFTQSWIFEETSGPTGAEALLNYNYETSNHLFGVRYPSITEFINNYLKDTLPSVNDGNYTRSIYLQDCALTIETHTSLYIASQYTTEQSPQDTIFRDIADWDYTAEGFTESLFGSLDNELMFGLTLTEMSYLAFGVVAMGYVLKLIGGG